MSRLHFHHVSHGMMSPAIVGLQLECPAAGVFRLGIVAALFEPKRLHAQHQPISRISRTPGRQDALGACSKSVAIAVKEIGQVADLQRQQVSRMIRQQPLEAQAHAVPVARSPFCNGLRMRTFPIRTAGVQGLQPLQALMHLGQHTALPHRDEHLGAQDMSHDEVRVGAQRLVNDRYCIAPIDIERGQRALIGVMAGRCAG